MTITINANLASPSIQVGSSSILLPTVPGAFALQGMLGMRNKVRNSRCDIAIARIGGSTNGYGIDGWKQFNGGTQTMSSIQFADAMVDSDNLTYCYKATVGTANTSLAAGDYSYLEQPIEGYLVRDLIGNPVAIQFKVKATKVGQYTVAIRNSGTDRSYLMTYTINSSLTWEQKYLTLPVGLITAGTWNWTTGVGLLLDFTIASGTQYTNATTNTWITGNYIAASGQVNGVDTTGNVFEISGVQLEKGSVSTPLEWRDIGSEIIFNQRYARLNRKAICYCTATTNLVYTEAFDSPMRANPTSATMVTTTPYCEQPVFTTGHNGSGSAIFGTHLFASSVDIGVNGFTGLVSGAMGMFEAGQVLYSAEL